jgi:ribonucleotide monophosphatase NagD (HAD superfamily)
MIYADAFKYSRMSGQQPLILALKAFMKHAFDKKVEIAQYGKPSQLSFEYGK